MKKRGASRMIERIKLAVCVVLFTLILSFTYMFLLGTRALDSGAKNESLEFSKLINAHGSHDGSELIRADMFLPEFIGLCTKEGEMVGVVANTDAVAELFGEIALQLKESLGEDDVESMPSDVWFDIASGECVYIRFFDSVPLSFVSAAVNSFDSCTEFEHDTSVKELIVSYDGSGAARLYVRSARGSVCRVGKSVGASVTVGELLSGIGESTRNDFEFAFNARRAERLQSFSSTQPLLSNSIRRFGIDIVKPSLEWESPLESPMMKELLSYYGFNIDKLNSYIEGDALISLQTHGTMEFYEGGFDYFAHEGQGVDISDYLDYIPSGSGSLCDEYRSIMIIASETARLFEDVSGDAVLSLLRVYRTERGVCAELGYSYANIPIVAQNASGVIEIADRTLSRASFSYLGANAQMYPQSVYSGEWLAVSKLRQLGRTDEYSFLEMSLVYFADDISKTIIPDWKVRGMK